MEGEECFRSFVQKQKVPCLFKTKSFFQAVKLSTFSPQNLAKILSRELIKFRVAKRKSSELQWEGACGKAEASVEEFLQWHDIEDCERTDKSGKRLQEIFGACCKMHYWCYGDYMYMKDLFHNHPEVLRLLSWDSLGFHNKDGADSTMWLGSKGAHTLCHYDTYGFNIVVQVSGTKKWILFPPTDGDCLYPTRIPYEESSVFSEVNIAHPDWAKHRRFSQSHPTAVELKPGDVLYVPHHWWHYVENMELSVSINLWYDLPCDAENRLKESITRLIIGSCVQNVTQPDVPWINPTEDENSLKSVTEGMKYFNQSLVEVAERKHASETEVHQGAPEDSTGPKKGLVKRFQNIESEVNVTRLDQCDFAVVFTDLPEFGGMVGDDEPVPPKRLKDAGTGRIAGTPGLVQTMGAKELSYEVFVKCLTHSDVLDAISTVALNRFGDG